MSAMDHSSYKMQAQRVAKPERPVIGFPGNYEWSLDGLFLMLLQLGICVFWLQVLGTPYKYMFSVPQPINYPTAVRLNTSLPV